METIPMLAAPFVDELVTEVWDEGALVQPKLDGVRCIAERTEAGVSLWSRNGRSLNFAAPHIVEQLADVPVGTYDGEIYSHGLPFEEINGRIGRKKRLHRLHRELSFHVFDIVSDAPQVERLAALETLAMDHFGDRLQVVPTDAVRTLEEIHARLAAWVSEGYEGVVVRNPEAVYQAGYAFDLMKWKPSHDDTYKIVGVRECSTGGGRVGAFELETVGGQRFRCGSGLTEAQRRCYWSERGALVGRFIRVAHQCLTGRGVPRFPVFLEVV